MIIIFLLPYVLLFLTSPALLGTFALGCLAARRVLRAEGDYARTLACLALNLWEPLITFAYNLVLLLAVLPTWYALRPLSATETAFLWTAPMVVVLVPAIAVRFRDDVYRLHGLLILALGGARWALAWLTIYYMRLPGEFDSNVFLAVGLSLGMLWLSLFWGVYVLRGPLASPREEQPRLLSQGLSFEGDV